MSWLRLLYLSGSMLFLAACHHGAVASDKVEEYPKLDHQKFAELPVGMARSEVESILQRRGSHQFSAILSQGEEAVCVSYYRNDVWGEYYCLFLDGKLKLICEPPPRKLVQVPYGGTVSNRVAPFDPEERLQAVLRADNLMGPRLRAEMQLRPKGPRPTWDPGLTIVGTMFMLLRNPGKEREFRKLVQLLDPHDIRLGSKMAEVESRLGAPLLIEGLAEGRQMRYYGSREFARSTNARLMLLSVVYEHDAVQRVFSKEFLDVDKILPPDGGEAGR